MKNGKIQSLVLSFGAVMITALLVSFVIPQDKQPLPWEVPAEYKNMKNANNDVALGKSLYMRNCASCHGKTGKGDGPKARNLETFSGDFTMEAYQKQTDGEMFYKTKVGRDDMPGYEGKLSDDDIWAMVSYMRTFKK